MKEIDVSSLVPPMDDVYRIVRISEFNEGMVDEVIENNRMVIVFVGKGDQWVNFPVSNYIAVYCSPEADVPESLDIRVNHVMFTEYDDFVQSFNQWGRSKKN
jgi:hypothetical protein